ncbi:MAG: DegV family protein [Faecousia sp.]
MSVRIVLDSSADFPQELKSRFSVVALPLFFGDEEYLDGVTITYKEFYEKLVETDVMPTTSQPTPGAFADAYREALEEYDEVVVITLSSQLSGTYQSACIAADDFPGKVFVVDSLSATIGTGALAQLALSLADQGLPAAVIASRLSEERNNLQLIAMVGTLEYLKRGGRLSKTAAIAGELLSIKPVIGIVEGKVAILGKARGSKQAGNMLVKLIQDCGGVDFEKPVILGYTGLSDALLQKYITDSKPLWEESPTPLAVTPVGSIIGTHAGPGAIAAAFFKK